MKNIRIDHPSGIAVVITPRHSTDPLSGPEYNLDFDLTERINALNRTGGDTATNTDYAVKMARKIECSIVEALLDRYAIGTDEQQPGDLLSGSVIRPHDYNKGIKQVALDVGKAMGHFRNMVQPHDSQPGARRF